MTDHILLLNVYTNKKNEIIIQLIQYILITISISIIIYCTTILLKQRTESKADKVKNPAVKIIDKYNNDNFKKFIDNPYSFEKLEKMYNSLTNNKIFEYIEIDFQVLEYRGFYSKSIKFVNTEDINLVNQKVDDDTSKEAYVTPLKSIQMGKSTSYNFNLKKMIYKGQFFNDSDYVLEYQRKSIPILLGYNYLETYKCGDQIEGYYLNNRFNFMVIGFLKPNSSIHINYNTYNLDNTIIIPFLECNYSPSNNCWFENTLYSQKTLGYIKYLLRTIILNALMN